MTCTRPFFNRGELTSCGKCEACLSTKSFQWTLRLRDELRYHDKSVFLTLTYDDENLEDINRRDVQLFLKRLRKEIQPKKIKYFGCAHYGSKTFRPHYHMIIFGIGGLAELKVYCLHGHSSSRLIDKVWSKGSCHIGTVTAKSIGYVTGYLRKKRELPYVLQKKCFNFQSQGLGLACALQEKEKIMSGRYLYEGKEVRIPRYYLNKLELELSDSEREKLERIKKRAIEARRYEIDYDQHDGKYLPQEEAVLEARKMFSKDVI